MENSAASLPVSGLNSSNVNPMLSGLDLGYLSGTNTSLNSGLQQMMSTSVPISDLNLHGYTQPQKTEIIPITNKDSLTGLIPQDSPIQVSYLGDQLLKGDADGDGDLEQDDYNAIVNARNTKASGANDLRDLDGNGRITVADARILGLQLRNNTDHSGPIVTNALLRDTAHDLGTTSDNITADPSVTGTVSDASGVTRVLATFDDIHFTNVTNWINADGSFTFQRYQLEQINGAPLGEGNHTFHLLAKDKWGNTTDFDINYTLNRVIYAAVDMMDEDLVLINTETDQILQFPLASLGTGANAYPGGNPQHAWITPDEKTIYLTSDNSATTPSAITVISIGDHIDWSGGPSDISISKVLILDPPGNPSNYPTVSQVDPSQRIASWTQPPLTQIHGPTFLPESPYTYMTVWTDNRFPVIDTRTNEFVSISPLTFGSNSNQTHTVTFNDAGTLGLGTGYYYDHNEIDLYSPNRETGQLTHISSVKLEQGNNYAAFTHHMIWRDNRYILTGSLQFGPTSLTPEGKNIIGPSIWLIDTLNPSAPTASLIIPHVNDPNQPGIYRSASDMAIVGNKLYVGEEDSLGDTFGRDGFVSVFDITDINNPVFLKRFKPGEDLPSDFAVAHGIAATPDGTSVYVTSYASNYIIKIDPKTDQVVKIYGAADGLMMPHGELIAGNYR